MTIRYIKKKIPTYLVCNLMVFFMLFCEGIIGEVIEPPEVIVPELGQENAITFTVETYEIDEVPNPCSFRVGGGGGGGSPLTSR